MGVISYECLTCGANLKYSPKRKKWHCQYCGNDFSIHELNEEFGTNELEQKEKYNCYKCSNCGAELIADMDTSATYCSYCNSSEIIKSRLNEEYRPKKIIPFEITKQQAINICSRLFRTSRFAPKEFNIKNISSTIKGMYIPCYLFDCDVVTNIDADVAKIIKGMNEYYKIKRRAVMRFKNIPIDGSINFPNSVMRSIEPFNYDDMVDFTPKYISGFFAERFNIISSAISKEIEKRAIMSVKKNWKKIISDNDKKYAVKYGGIVYDSYMQCKDDTKVIKESVKSEYILVPVWLLKISYNNKLYTIAINRSNRKGCGGYSY
jgi:DNA-directed RNA polymerase subunit RPC12/RpoP